MSRDHTILRDIWAILDPDSAISGRESGTKMSSDKATERKKEQRVRDNEKIHTLIRAHKVRGEKAIAKQGMIKGWRLIDEEDSSEDEDILEDRYPTDLDNLGKYFTSQRVRRPSEE
jgi:hypothetical protein